MHKLAVKKGEDEKRGIGGPEREGEGTDNRGRYRFRMKAAEE